MFQFSKDMRALRRFVRPRREFLPEARADFLRALSERHTAVPVSVSSPVVGGARIMVRYATLVVAFMFALNGGAVVLADSQNVAPNHPLYPYKRLGENIQLSVAPAASRPALRSKFAERRLEEIKEVADHYKIRLKTCCEKAIDELGLAEKGSCVNGRVLNKIFGDGASIFSDKSQRSGMGCGCTYSLDIGSYSQKCSHLCPQCYAR